MRARPGPKPDGAPAPTLVRLAALCALLAGCGQAAAPAPPGWASHHHGTAVLHFQAAAPGVCAITVRYPDEAPAAIEYLGTTYVQLSRLPHPASPAGTDLGRSGDWRALLQGNRDILLVTPGAAFDYRLESGC